MAPEPNFNSNYCWGKELELALARQVDEGLHVMPIVVKPCDWGSTPLGRLEALPLDGKAVANWSTHDNAWVNVIGSLRDLVLQISDQPRERSRRLV